MAHVIDVNQVIHRRNSLEESQLEYPPNEELDAEQDIAEEGDDGGHNEDQERNPAIDDIPVRKGLRIPAQGPSLEQGEQQQERREDDVQQAVGNEGDPQRDDDQAQQEDRQVQPDSLPDGVAFQADDQGNQDGRQHPGELHEEFRGHREEVLPGKGARDHNAQREDDDSGDQGHLETMTDKGFLSEEGNLPGQESDQGKTQQG